MRLRHLRLAVFTALPLVLAGVCRAQELPPVPISPSNDEHSRPGRTVQGFDVRDVAAVPPAAAMPHSRRPFQGSAPGNVLAPIGGMISGPGSADLPPMGSRDLISDDNQSASVRAVARQAAQITSDGLKLATKGAAYASRARFIQALELIADARDATDQTQFHSRALTAGLTALKEADDFSRPDRAGAATVDPVAGARAHVTPLLKDAPGDTVTRLQALQLYYSYATSQLAAAVGGVPEASTALYYLARLQPFLGRGAERTAVLAEPKALAIQQAAVLVDSDNFRAANDLGVLLARCGQFEQARRAFLYSASIERRPEVFENLAVVYKRVGDDPDAFSMARMAEDERRRRGSLSLPPKNRPLVYWVDHKTFAGETGSADASLLPPAPKMAGTNVPPPKPSDAEYRLAAIPNGSPQEFLQPLSWEVFAQGEYIGPARLQHVPEYYLRVDDSLGFVFRVNGKPSTTPYRLAVGDVIKIGSMTVTSLSIETPIQPDGTIILPQVGPVTAAGKAIESLRMELDERFKPYLKEPAITITPVSLNKTLEELRNAITNRSGIFAGQSFQSKVSPNGTVQLPAIGSVPAQGLTLSELRAEIEPRYAELVNGIEITPVLTERAPRSVYVLGEVQKPGKYPLDAPTTTIQAIALAGSWNIGGNLKEVIVFRRDEEWRLMATRVCVRPALYNSRSLQADDIWLRDSDIVIVPKLPIQVFDDWVNLVFTKGIYGVIPVSGVSLSFFQDLTTLGQLAH